MRRAAARDTDRGHRGMPWRRIASAVPVIAAGLVLAGCATRFAPHQVEHAWRPLVACPAPSAVGTIAGLTLAFSHPDQTDRTVTGTGCDYQTATGGTTLTLAGQPGSPTSVTYNTAAGVSNTPNPALGTGAHLGTSTFFCGAAVPATDDRTLTVSLQAGAGHTVHCGSLVRLLKTIGRQG